MYWGTCRLVGAAQIAEFSSKDNACPRRSDVLSITYSTAVFSEDKMFEAHDAHNNVRHISLREFNAEVY
jgi:hypothetical protein